MCISIQFPKKFNEYNFKTLSKIESHPRTKIRLLALHHLQQGKSYAEVSNYMQVHVSTVKSWMWRFRVQGLLGIEEGLRSGRRSKVEGLNANEEIKEKILKMYTKSDTRVTL